MLSKEIFMKKLPFLALQLLAAALVFISCGAHDDFAEHNIKWDGDNGGTLEVINGSTKDIVVFHGQVPTKNSIMGGIRAGVTKTFDVSKYVDDFDVGGYIILKGISREEYLDGKLSDPKVEFRAMATYKRGTKYRIQIDASYMGEYGFKVNNTSSVGLELRKNSPDGEKVAYLGAFESNQMIYTSTKNSIRLFPVYVYYNKSTGEVTTLKTADIFSSVNAAPRELAGATSMNGYSFPSEDTNLWDEIKKTLKTSVAYIKIRNNMSNQEAAYLTIGGSNYLYSQSGYDAVGSGEPLVFEIEGSDMAGGLETNLMVNIYNGLIKIPVLMKESVEEEINGEEVIVGEDGEEETVPTTTIVTTTRMISPKLKNGYDYEITVKGNGRELSGYTAEIVESDGPRDLSYLIGTK
jgi:hypothetical protein